MSLRASWYLPRFRDDGAGSGGGYSVPEIRAMDRQTFEPGEIKAMQATALDYEAADRRWSAQYGQGIEDHKRRFAVFLAKHLSVSQRDFVRAQRFYTWFADTYPKPQAVKASGISVRSLRTWAKEADELGLFSLERGGEESGVAEATANEVCLFFTSFQKHRLMVATGATGLDTTRIMGHRGRPLSGPER